MTLGSLFDGIGGWLLAARHAGIEPIWASEIEPFPASVTAYHFPNVVQLGDITKLDGAKLWPVDIVCVGSPCQDLSVANGKREGLKGERSGLFLRAIKLIRAMRRASGGRFPRFFVWENVPGAFSSNRGADFRAVLEEITEAEIPMPENNKWADAGMVEWAGGSLAWRILDAQYWGVPQRRRRIFLVCDFGGRSAGEILFERESVRRDSSAGGETRQRTAAGTESGIDGASVVRMRAGKPGGGKGALVSRELSLTLAANTNDQVLFTGNCLTPWDCQAKRIYNESGVFPALQAAAENGEKPGSVYVPVAVYDMTHADEVMRPVEGGKCQTLNARMGTGGNQVPVLAFGNGQVHQSVSDKAGALNCMHDQQAVMTVGALCADDHKGINNQYVEQGKCVIQKSVRRLTPLECERLQGLPDGYTDVSCNGKPASDTARYKALGNGMAQPCADYVIRRIVEVCDGQ